MRGPFEVAFAIGVLVIAGCTVHYFVAAFLWPEHVAAREHEEDWKRTAFGNFFLYGYAFIAFLGVAFFIYQGVARALEWIPESWMTLIVRESERDSTTSIIALLIAFFCALGLVSGLSKLCAQIAREKIEARRLRSWLRDAIDGKLE